jgi:hypothetical protein
MATTLCVLVATGVVVIGPGILVGCESEVVDYARPA